MPAIPATSQETVILSDGAQRRVEGSLYFAFAVAVAFVLAVARFKLSS